MKHSTIPVVHSTIPFHHSIPPNVDTPIVHKVLLDFHFIKEDNNIFLPLLQGGDFGLPN